MYVCSVNIKWFAPDRNSHKLLQRAVLTASKNLLALNIEICTSVFSQMLSLVRYCVKWILLYSKGRNFKTANGVNKAPETNAYLTISTVLME